MEFCICLLYTSTGCYFLPSAFATNTDLGTFGTANRRFFHGPGFNNTDFGFLKQTVIKENYAFDLRVEFFNIFNHAQLHYREFEIAPTGDWVDLAIDLDHDSLSLIHIYQPHAPGGEAAYSLASISRQRAPSWATTHGRILE